jgi:hypothetical protein
MTRLTDQQIREEAQALRASLDGRPAANHEWLDKLLTALEAEREHAKKLEGAIKEAQRVLDAKFNAYGVGPRPQSPPAWLINLAVRFDALAAGLKEEGT